MSLQEIQLKLKRLRAIKLDETAAQDDHRGLHDLIRFAHEFVQEASQMGMADHIQRSAARFADVMAPNTILSLSLNHNRPKIRTLLQQVWEDKRRADPELCTLPTDHAERAEYLAQRLNEHDRRTLLALEALDELLVYYYGEMLFRNLPDILDVIDLLQEEPTILPNSSFLMTPSCRRLLCSALGECESGHLYGYYLLHACHEAASPRNGKPQNIEFLWDVLVGKFRTFKDDFASLTDVMQGAAEDIARKICEQLSDECPDSASEDPEVETPEDRSSRKQRRPCWVAPPGTRPPQTFCDKSIPGYLYEFLAAITPDLTLKQARLRKLDSLKERHLNGTLLVAGAGKKYELFFLHESEYTLALDRLKKAREQDKADKAINQSETNPRRTKQAQTG